MNQYVFKKEELNPEEQTQIKKLNEQITDLNNKIIMSGVPETTISLFTTQLKDATEKINKILYVTKKLDNKTDAAFLNDLELIPLSTSIKLEPEPEPDQEQAQLEQYTRTKQLEQ